MKAVEIKAEELAKEINSFYRIFNKVPYLIMSQKTSDFIEKHTSSFDIMKRLIEVDLTDGKTLIDDKLEFGEILVR